MRKVLKFPWPDFPVVLQVNMPAESEIVAFQLQYGLPAIWAIGDPDNAFGETRTFQLVGTGHDIPEGKYIGTVQLDEGRLVLHAFETTKR